jgi:hypothetical protein
MTCQELRLFFEDPFRRDGPFGPEAEHLAHCADCARFVEAQRELGTGLRLARELAPRFPAALDEVVLANYRREIAKTAVGGKSNGERRRWAAWGWSAAAAAVVLAAALLSLPGRKDPVARPESPAAFVSMSPPTSTESTAPSRPEPVHSAGNRTLRKPAAQVGTTRDRPVAADFRSLMYCDELSCGGPLAVIRVQLPASSAGLTALNSKNDAVFADVLVGPDGIARGIRIVQ